MEPPSRTVLLPVLCTVFIVASAVVNMQVYIPESPTTTVAREEPAIIGAGAAPIQTTSTAPSSSTTLPQAKITYSAPRESTTSTLPAIGPQPAKTDDEPLIIGDAVASEPKKEAGVIDWLLSLIRSLF